MKPSQSKPRRIEEIDILRIGAAFGVILFHWWQIIWGDLSAFPSSTTEFLSKTLSLPTGPFYALSILGDNAVPLFLVISVYCLSKKKRTNRTWIIPRLTKVLKPYWISVLMSLPILLLLFWINPTLMEYAGVKTPSIRNTISGLFLLQNTTKETILTPYPALWFIPIIIHLYLLFPILTWLQKRITSMQFLLITGFTQLLQNLWILFLVEKNQELPLWLRFSGLSYIFLFATAMRLADSKFPKWWIGLIIWMFGLMLRFDSNRLIIFSEAMIGIGLFSMGYELARTITAKHRRFSISLSTLGKDYSYLIYLWHQPILLLIAITVTPSLTKNTLTLFPFIIIPLVVFLLINTTRPVLNKKED